MSTTMSFSGRSLDRVRSAIDGAIRDLRNEIATCPNVFQYEDDIDACEAEIAALEKLAARIDRRTA